jgi:hypothetical protein
LAVSNYFPSFSLAAYNFSFQEYKVDSRRPVCFHVPDIPTLATVLIVSTFVSKTKKVKIYQIISALTVHHSGLASQINPVPVGRPQTFLPGLERLNYRCTIFVSFFVFKSSKNPKQQNNLICEENSPSELCYYHHHHHHHQAPSKPRLTIWT